MIAREFLRVSIDRSGRERSQTEQHADIVAAFEFEFGDPYLETGSASEYRKGERGEAWTALVDDLDADRFGADVLVLWESSRITREVDDLETLIRLCRLRGVRIAVLSDERIYNPANHNDRKDLRNAVVEAAHSSDLTSVRVRRNVKAAAKDGRPHGRIPYGYRRLYDPVTREAKQEAHPREAEVVTELYRRVAAGHPLAAIARDLASRGVTSRGTENVPARPLTTSALRWIATSPAYAGKRAHRPGGRRGTGDVQVVDATWPALVSADEWHRVQRILTAPSRKTHRSGRAVHLLTRIARCGKPGCDGWLGAGYRHGIREYQCQFGHVRCNADDLDRWAEVEIVRYLADPAEWETAFGVDDYDEQAAPIRDEIAEIEATLADLYERVRRRKVSPEALEATEPGLLDDLDAANRRLAALSTPLHLSTFIEPGPDVAERWVAAPVAARREVARLLLGPGGKLGSLRLGPAPNRQAAPIAERVTMTR